MWMRGKKSYGNWEEEEKENIVFYFSLRGKRRKRTLYLYPTRWWEVSLGTLSSSVNFINVSCAAFTCADPKCAKKIDGLTVFFALLAPSSVKAARKMLVKSTQRVDFSNLLSSYHFIMENLSSSLFLGKWKFLQFQPGYKFWLGNPEF